MPEQFAKLQKLIGNRTKLINMPMIKVEQLAANPSLIKQINYAEKYNWVLFTSTRAVDFFFNLYNKNIENLNNVKFACIGSSTQKQLKTYNIKSNYLNEGTTSIDFAKYLINNKIIKRTDKVMHPTGNKASSYLSDKLNTYCSFTTVVIYKTTGLKQVNTEALEHIKNNRYKLILFTSPSAFVNFVEITKNLIEQKELKIATIGKITDKAVRKQGFTSTFVADKPNLEALAQELLAFVC